jgi:hypothetical protein
MNNPKQTIASFNRLKTLMGSLAVLIGVVGFKLDALGQG